MQTELGPLNCSRNKRKIVGQVVVQTKQSLFNLRGGDRNIYLFGVYLTIYIYINMVFICINTMCTCIWYPGPRPSLLPRGNKMSEMDCFDNCSLSTSFSQQLVKCWCKFANAATQVQNGPNSQHPARHRRTPSFGAFLFAIQLTNHKSRITNLET